MGNYSCRRKGYLAAWQIMVCEYVFQGMTDPYIVEHVFNITKEKDGEKAYRNYRDKLWRLKKDPKFREYYNSMVTEYRVHGYGKAIHKLTDLIDDQNPWVAMQASNSVLSHTEKVVTGEDENTVTVKIEGAPVLGVPTTEETDGEG